MAFQVRSRQTTKGVSGRYTLSYGKGKKKITADAWLNEVAGGWQIAAGHPGAHVSRDPFKRYKDLKEAWSEWVAGAYESGGSKAAGESSPSTPTRSGPPSLKRKGPPSIKKSGPPSLRKSEDGPAMPVALSPKGVERLKDICDPSNRKLRTEDGDYTDLGMMVFIAYHLETMYGNPRAVAVKQRVQEYMKLHHPDLCDQDGFVSRGGG